jgi:hypothetical protein
MEQNDNPGGSIGGNTGSTGGGFGSVGGAGGAASGSGSVGSGFGSQEGSAGSYDDFGDAEVHYYRSDFDARTDRPADHTFDTARAGYQLGHTAAAQPVNQNRDFMEVEVDLEKQTPQYAAVRDYARSGFEWKKVLGGLALAGGAYWAGKKVYESLSESKEHETHYRTHYEAHPARTTVTYPQARTYYVVGYTAARNPAYVGRSFDEVEPEIRRGFTGPRSQSYESMRDFCRYGYERGTSGTRGTGSSAGM